MSTRVGGSSVRPAVTDSRSARMRNDRRSARTSPLSSRHRLGFLLCVIGPPAVGKSTVADGLADELPGSVFNLHRFLRRCRVQGRLDGAPGRASEWSGGADDLVGTEVLLRHAFAYGRFPALGCCVLLDGLPRTADELGLVLGVARLADTPVGMVELTAPEEIVMTRAFNRRVCAACAPDSDGEPSVPARSVTGLLVRCGACGGPLSVRLGDSPAALLRSVDLYRRHRALLAEAATAARVPLIAVDATPDVYAVRVAATAAAALLIATASHEPP